MSVALPWGVPLVVEDLEAMPDDGHRYELVEGTLLVTPAPSAAHQTCVLMLAAALMAGAQQDDFVLAAPFDYVVGPRTSLQPDLLVTRRADLGPARLERTPLLVVEVQSPSTRLVDLNLKRATYEAAGVPAYWLVDPAIPSLIVLHLDRGRYCEQATVTGNDAYHSSFPCTVTIVPADLLRGLIA